MTDEVPGATSSKRNPITRAPQCALERPNARIDYLSGIVETVNWATAR